jgi:GxxExxY protein
MPISCPIAVRSIDQEEFCKLDYRVMGLAFETHNELGRLCDEVVYHNDLAARLEAAGVGSVYKEVPVTVTHCDFAKTYWLDLVVVHAAIYELKTEARLAPDHDAQLLNYLFLFGAHHGKLINFRPEQIESRFINTTLTPKTRREFELDTQRWSEPDDPSKFLRTRLVELLEDWGAFLELPLYTEALTYFLGGEQKVVRMVPLQRDGVPLGNQRMHLISADIAFRLTALTANTERYERNLRLLLAHSPLSAIQWMNMSRHRVEFVTLTK